MPKSAERQVVVTPFIMAHQQQNIDGNTKPLKRPGAHLSKDQMTRDVLKRIVNRVKKI